jgi:dihydrofolate synthase/folylpolyglutamate synthase
MSDIADKIESDIRRHAKFGSVLGLERMLVLMDKLGNPHDELNVIHVAGTNGKGSVCRYIYEVLLAHGYSCGLFISPFITVFNERIQLNGENISDDDLEKYSRAVLDVSSRMPSEAPTEFEIITAIALLYFAEKKPDFVILEVGLGGRGDSTNIIAAPLVSVITQIAMDHTDRLGDTIELIAAEKAGIIKRGCPVVTVADGVAARVIARKAYSLDAPFFSAVQSVKDVKVKEQGHGSCDYAQDDTLTSFCAKSQNPQDVCSPDDLAVKTENILSSSEKMVFSSSQRGRSAETSGDFLSSSEKMVFGSSQRGRPAGISGYVINAQILGVYYRGIEISMLGLHQVENAVCALTALEILREAKHIRMDSGALKVGMLRATMPGRFEIVSTNPIVVLDGAHNAAGATALNATVSEIFHSKKVLALLGILADKDAEAVLKSVIDFADGLLLTTAPTDRGMSAAELRGLACAFTDEQYGDKILLEAVDVPVDALVRARQLAEKDGYDVIIICGSLYLIAELRGLILDEESWL